MKRRIDPFLATFVAIELVTICFFIIYVLKSRG
jgi:hypothetical protein